jgi:Sulfotransferase family
MPRVKEPHFFATDLKPYPIIQTPEAYAALFRDRTPDHLAAGEASVYYLRSTAALPNIRAFNPDARIIAMFRNPVDMVYALHAQLLYVSEEPVADFEAAWRLQSRRAQGLDLPKRSRGSFLLQYGEFARFGTQVERLLANFPESHVKLILHEDFAADPERVYREVVRFLGLPHDNRTEFPRVNDSKRARVPWLRDFLRKPPPLLHQTVRSLKRAVGAGPVESVKRAIVTRNTVTAARSPLSPAFRAELVEEFRGEVMLFSRLLQRDLTHWK